MIDTRKQSKASRYVRNILIGGLVLMGTYVHGTHQGEARQLDTLTDNVVSIRLAEATGDEVALDGKRDPFVDELATQGWYAIPGGCECLFSPTTVQS